MIAEDDQPRLGIEDLEQRRRCGPEPLHRIVEPDGRVVGLAGCPGCGRERAGHLSAQGLRLLQEVP